MAHYLSYDDRRNERDVYRRGSNSDVWVRMFLSGKISRHSCMICHYQTTQRVSDFTHGYIWETGNTKLDDNNRSKLVHVWTQKEVLNSIGDNVCIMAYPEEKSRGMERRNNLTVQ